MLGGTEPESREEVLSHGTSSDAEAAIWATLGPPEQGSNHQHSRELVLYRMLNLNLLSITMRSHIPLIFAACLAVPVLVAISLCNDRPYFESNSLAFNSNQLPEVL
ncbi:predicted protein [Coccidioides posadasii str. Silveira]|uniref:Predicted protein n=2 Tax=Coccidioides posadasii TaxID=199306 RepID=E9CXM1_COCPS|nr:predicted protein [Coccidioides posadasii str. Silveira]KMM72744.1 hypothetical protein CPAG_09036 [Coccidioides posadasii RMSCC 3488]